MAYLEVKTPEADPDWNAQHRPLGVQRAGPISHIGGTRSSQIKDAVSSPASGEAVTG
jgi:hypothetical protein